MTFSLALFGATGLTGRNILSVATSLDQISSITTISRRNPADSINDANCASGTLKNTSKLHPILEKDSTAWPSRLQSITNPSGGVPDVVMSALGTTRGQAGGIKEQWKIDHDLNIELAKTAKAQGVKTYMFVSSAGTRGFLSNMIPYSKMKIGVEDAIKELGFEQAIILRPGAILGPRDAPHPGGPAMNSAINSLAWFGQGARDAMGQDADVIAKAGLTAVMKSVEGTVPEGKKGFWVLEQKDILKYGRDEWKV